VRDTGNYFNYELEFAKIIYFDASFFKKKHIKSKKYSIVSKIVDR
jgi:hypothetical protein